MILDRAGMVERSEVLLNQLLQSANGIQKSRSLHSPRISC
jgi:hypothetical protein